MDTYNRIITDARVNNKPIGPKFHAYDRQRKEFDAKSPTKEEARVLTQTRTATAVVTKEQTREAIKAKIQAKVTAPRVQTLREKYEAEQIKKIADGYKVDEGIRYVSKE
jgi:hypothetical protein